jgi:predicted metal-dependent HD superfamily phosphohydrolase
MEKRSTQHEEAGLDTGLEGQWYALIQTFSDDQDLAGEMFTEITERYTALGRHYHTLAHLAHLLRLFQEHRYLVQDQAAVQFAIWYHDLVYDPLKADNERLSADIAGQRLHSLSVPDPVILKVKRLIVATRQHALHPEKEDFDSQFFLDCDLAILGADRERYAEYMQEIRLEYSIVPLSDYSEGRKAMLQRFLAREAIYGTAEFQERFEEQARSNMQFELILLGGAE